MAIASLAPAGSAQAGSYDVWSCRTPQGSPAAIGDANSGWRPATSGHTGLTTENRCSTSGYLLARLGNYAYPWGSRAQWNFLAPANTQITAFDVHWSGYAGGVQNSTSWVGDVAMWRSDQIDPTYVSRHYGGGSFGSSTPLADSNRVTQSGLGISSLSVMAGCSPGFGAGTSECPPAGGGETSTFRIYRSKFTLSDSSAPTVGSITGDSLDDGVFAGDETFSVNATDTGSGVYRLIVAVDGVDTLFKVINPDGGRCADVEPGDSDPYEFVQPQPCPLSNSGDVTVDTTALPEGEHSLRIKVEDASGNKTTVWGPATKVVDNVPPPAPVDPDGSGPQSAAPTIAGVPKEGNTLVADPGTWSGESVTFAYAWERCDAAGANCAPIAGATDKTHTLTSSDVGKRIRVVVTATNEEGSTPAASAPTAAVVAAGCTSGCAAPSTAPDGGSGSGSASGTGAAGASGAVAPGGVNGMGGSALSKVSAAYEGQKVVKTRWGQRVRITGRLLNEHGSPVTGAVLDLLERPRSGGELRVVGTVTTASDGTFSYLLPAGASRLVRFAYRYIGGTAEYTHVSDVDVLVKAKVAFRATRRVRGSNPLRFRGRVPGALPGSVVLLQARVGTRWQIFEKARITSSRRFSAKYVFRRTHRPTTFAFRALYPGRDTANLDRAFSRIKKVRYLP